MRHHGNELGIESSTQITLLNIDRLLCSKGLRRYNYTPSDLLIFMACGGTIQAYEQHLLGVAELAEALAVKTKHVLSA